MILYFSGTGNSRYAAQKIGDITGDTLLSLNEKIKAGDFTGAETAEKLVIAVPTYAWRIPNIVGDWLKQAVLPEGVPAWFVMTCGSGIAGAGEFNAALCAEKGLRYMGTAKIVMPENYIAMFNAPKEEKAKAIIAKAEPLIREAGEQIRAGEPFPAGRSTLYDRCMSRRINPLFYRGAVKSKAFFAKDSCIGCGKCVTLCPLNNIRLNGGRPMWGENCTHCMACICRCPKEAIEYGRKTAGKPRYHIDG